MAIDFAGFDCNEGSLLLLVGDTQFQTPIIVMSWRVRGAKPNDRQHKSLRWHSEQFLCGKLSQCRRYYIVSYYVRWKLNEAIILQGIHVAKVETA